MLSGEIRRFASRSAHLVDDLSRQPVKRLLAELLASTLIEPGDFYDRANATSCAEISRRHI